MTDSKQRPPTKNRICQSVEFDVRVDHGVKQKERGKRDNYVDITKEMKKKKKQQQWYMKMRLIPFVIVLSLQSLKDWYRDWRSWK